MQDLAFFASSASDGMSLQFFSSLALQPCGSWHEQHLQVQALSSSCGNIFCTGLLLFQLWLLAAMCFLMSLSTLGQSLFLSKWHHICDCRSVKLLQHHQHGRGNQSFPNKDTTGSNNQLNASFTKEKVVSFCSLSRLISRSVNTDHLL